MSTCQQGFSVTFWNFLENYGKKDGSGAFEEIAEKSLDTEETRSTGVNFTCPYTGAKVFCFITAESNIEITKSSSCREDDWQEFCKLQRQ